MVGGRWKSSEELKEEARQRVVRSILNGTLKVRYIERGSDPYQPNGGSSMVGRTPDEMSWVERTLLEAHQQKPRLEEIVKKANAELAGIDRVIEALEEIEETGGGITTPLVEPTTPPPTPKPQFRTLADVSDDEIIEAVKLLGGATGGWVSSGPVKRELKLKDDAQISPRLRSLIDVKALRKKGAGPGTMYRVREEKPVEEKPAEKKTPPPTSTKTGDRTVTHPGAEAMPEHLQGMPVASKNMPLKQRIVTAEGQLKVFNYIVETGPSVTPEVSQGLKMSRENVKRYLDDLVGSGLLERTDNWRRAHGQTAGRTAVEYRVSGGEPQASPKDQLEVSEEEPVSSPEPEPEPVERPTLEEVRNATAKMPDTFSVSKLVTENQDKEWKFEATRQRLDQLAERGILEKAELVEGDPNMVIYSYIETTEPGAASMIDQARKAEEAAHGPGALEVAGTGRPQLPSNKEAAETVRAARRSGCEVIPVAQGHWAVLTPEGRRILIAGTPSSSKSVEADRKKLRRIGVNV